MYAKRTSERGKLRTGICLCINWENGVRLHDLDVLRMKKKIGIRIVKQINNGNFSIFLSVIGIFNYFRAWNLNQYPLQNPPRVLSSYPTFREEAETLNLKSSDGVAFEQNSLNGCLSESWIWICNSVFSIKK